MKINSPDLVETIDFYLDPIKHPLAYNAKLKELIECGMTEKEAMRHLQNNPVLLELYYSSNQGLFMIESEFIEVDEPYNPYDGKKMER
jgi:hypothetical protein